MVRHIDILSLQIHVDVVWKGTGTYWAAAGDGGQIAGCPVHRNGSNLGRTGINNIGKLICCAATRWRIIATRWGGRAIVSAAASGEEQHRRDRKHPQFVEESPLSQLRSGGSAAHVMSPFDKQLTRSKNISTYSSNPCRLSHSRPETSPRFRSEQVFHRR